MAKKLDLSKIPAKELREALRSQEKEERAAAEAEKKEYEKLRDEGITHVVECAHAAQDVITELKRL